MDTETSRIREGHARFAARITSLPEIAQQAFDTAVAVPPFDPLRLRRIGVTGLGSSEAHARLLVACLVDELGMDAHFIPTGALLEGPPSDASRDALIVFSQGLSPNARFALTAPEAWGALGIATAVSEAETDPDRRALLERVDSVGGWRVFFPPEGESGTLVRVAGPLAGCIMAIRMAVQLGHAAGRSAPALSVSPAEVVQAIRNAPGVVDRALQGGGDSALDASIGLLASGRYAGLLHNLRLKWLETLLRPLPPVWELLDFSHGPFQQSLAEGATWLALTRADAQSEGLLLSRIESMLADSSQRLLRLPSTLPGVWSLVEHEAELNALVLRALVHSRVDLEHWPGKNADGPLYEMAPRPETELRAKSGISHDARLDTTCWPQLAERLSAGRTSVVIPLGATEQHGAHLPLATDTWIADALAERLCARHPELIRLPALPIGCSEEHASFPGTLSLRPETLGRVLEDLLTSLSAHGFARAFLFSAHGGNYAPLSKALPALRGASRPMRVDAFTDLDQLARLQHQTARAHGVTAAEAGHHAGEFETSLLRALAPQHVRRDALAAGLLHADADAQALFYPDLRAHAPDGVVGDPRAASPKRAAPYLDAWTELLDAAYCAM